MMKMLVLCVSLFALFGIIQGGEVVDRSFLLPKLHGVLNQTRIYFSDDSMFYATVNEFGDKIVAHLDEMLMAQGYDPMPVDDIKKGYWWGNLKLTQIHVDGMTTLYRPDNMELSYNHNTKQLQIDLPLAFIKLQFECKYKAALIGIGPRGRITGEVKSLQMITSIIIDYEVNEAHIRKYKITKSGHISIKLHGNPLTDWANNLIMGATTSIFKFLILDVVDIMVNSTLNSIVGVINMLLKAILD